MFTEEIHQLLLEKFQEESFRDCFLVAIEQHGKQVSIFLDSDTGITFDRCKAISRYLESHLDEKKWLGEDYVLEVSSAGIGRPLIYPRQYLKNMGRLLKVVLSDGEVREGTIVGADDQKVILEWTEERKENKKKVKETQRLEIPYGQIKEAKIQIKI
jgi:ribosome maturation factor RimP